MHEEQYSANSANFYWYIVTKILNRINCQESQCRCLSSSRMKIRHYPRHLRVPTHPSAERTSTTQTKKWSTLLLRRTQARKWQHLNSYTLEERAQIGKYSLEDGNTRATRHFSKVLNQTITESTATRLKGDYVQALAQRKNGHEGPLVKCLPTKHRKASFSCPRSWQGCPGATRAAGGVVNTAIVMAAAVGIMSSRDVTKLSLHGGCLNVTKTWAKSLLKRMWYVKRECSNTRKNLTHTVCRDSKSFLGRYQGAGELMNDIPDELTKLVFHLSLPMCGPCTMLVRRLFPSPIPMTNVK